MSILTKAPPCRRFRWVLAALLLPLLVQGAALALLFGCEGCWIGKLHLSGRLEHAARIGWQGLPGLEVSHRRVDYIRCGARDFWAGSDLYRSPGSFCLSVPDKYMMPTALYESWWGPWRLQVEGVDVSGAEAVTEAADYQVAVMQWR